MQPPTKIAALSLRTDHLLSDKSYTIRGEYKAKGYSHLKSNLLSQHYEENISSLILKMALATCQNLGENTFQQFGSLFMKDFQLL